MDKRIIKNNLEHLRMGQVIVQDRQDQQKQEYRKMLDEQQLYDKRMHLQRKQQSMVDRHHELEKRQRQEQNNYTRTLEEQAIMSQRKKAYQNTLLAQQEIKKQEKLLERQIDIDTEFRNLKHRSLIPGQEGINSTLQRRRVSEMNAYTLGKISPPSMNPPKQIFDSSFVQKSQLANVGPVKVNNERL